jgi:dipeptidyl aminopeptidase/acylaminoacyl peptidase
MRKIVCRARARQDHLPYFEAVGLQDRPAKRESREVQHSSRDPCFRPADLLRERVIEDIAVSPDGAQIAYALRTIDSGRYRTRIFLQPSDGGRPEPLALPGRRNGRPRFSPNGRSLLLLSDRDGASRPWIAPLAGGEPRALAELPGPASSADWSPDGRTVLVLAPDGPPRFALGPPREPTALRIRELTWRANGVGVRDRYTCAFTLPSKRGPAQRVTEPSYEVTGVFWCAGGVGFLADLRPEAALHEFASAWRVATGGEKPEPLARLRGAIYAATSSAAGKLALVGVDRPGAPSWANPTLHLVEDGHARRLAPGLRFPVARANWTDLLAPGHTYGACWVDEAQLASLVTVEGAVVPYLFGTDGSYAPLLQGSPVCSRLASGGGRLAVIAAEGGRPGELCLIEDGRLRPLTRAGGDWLGRRRKQPERLRIRQTSGHHLDGWLTRAGSKQQPAPLVLHVHGGPHSAHGPTPWLEMLALADAGIHVLAANPRGSAGYGEAFARAVHGRWGEPDGEDLLALLDTLVDQGLADRDRIGVLGTSYGGFMVNWLLGHFPGRFAAAVSENPITDQAGFFGSSAMGPVAGVRHSGLGKLPEDLERFLEHSPYVQIARNTAPLLLLHAEQDLTCPIGQSELVFTILRSRGRTTELVRYPDEDHDMLYTGRPDRRVDRIERIVAWFTRYLVDGAPASSTRRRAAGAGSRS